MKKLELAENLLEELNADAAQLIEYIRRSDAPDEVLQSSAEHIRQAVELLEPWNQDGVHSASFPSHGREGFVYTEQNLISSMPYSPVTGRKNPVSPAISLRREGDGVVGSAYFSPTFAGPPNCVHGGIVAAVFDELLSLANIAQGVAGFTGTLSIRYHQPTPLETSIELRARCVRVSGRKVQSTGEMLVNGEVTASAEGLFIKPRSEHKED